MRRFLAALLGFSVSFSYAEDIDLDKLNLPNGFSISVYAEVPGPRQMTLGANKVVYVGYRSGGKVLAVPDANNDNKAETIITVVEGLNNPNGVTYYNGDLYIGEINRISKIPDIDNRLAENLETETINDSLPNRRHHGYRFLEFGPDGLLYVPIGAPCNLCEEEAIFASIHTMNADGTNMQVLARGVRNSVGFDWHPATGEFWFTDNGRDMMGDNIPPGEINRLTERGQHFGFPYIHAGDIPDPDFGKGKNVADYTPPAHKLDAHVAPLGMTFYTGDMFPAEYKNAIIVAEHGSWNRSQKIGYRVMVGLMNENNEIKEYRPLIDGWLDGQVSHGRPVDVINMADGSILISDDSAGVIYRVAYGE